MEIKEGMYVRYIRSFKDNDSTKKVVEIDKVRSVDEYTISLESWNDKYRFGLYDFKGLLTKEPSFNILDLIEPCDIVNGVWVEKNTGEYLETLEVDYEASDLGSMRFIRIYPKDIYEILTHEQYTANVYSIKK